MSRPYKHPKTGVYWVRKVIPKELRPLVGQGELKRSLKTKDPAEAKRLALAVIAELEQVVTSARMGQRYSRADVDALAGEYLRKRRAEILAEARKEHWTADRFENEELGHDLIRDTAPSPEAEEAAVLAWGTPFAEEMLSAHGAYVPPRFKEALAVALYLHEPKAIAAAYDAYFLHDTSVRDHEESEAPPFRPPAARSITGLFKQYAEAAQLRPRTVADWGRVIAHFEGWLKGKAADKVTPQDILRYGEAVRDGGGLSGRKLTAKRVNEGYLAAIRATYAWATKPGRALVPKNPAERISVETPRRETGYRRRAYTRDEVAKILAAARLEDTPYKRWTPWLLAFTGARVSEILNARKADIGQTEGIWYLNIRGEVKTEWSTRCVPLHSALIAEGFLDYWRSLPDGEYLFPGKWSDKHGSRTSTPRNRLRDWLKPLVEDQDNISPNHSFRHWLISECKRAGIDPDYQRQLTGHSTKDAHGRYGPGDVPVLMEVMELIPSPLKG